MEYSQKRVISLKNKIHKLLKKGSFLFEKNYETAYYNSVIMYSYYL